MCSTVDPGLCSEAPVVCPLVATLRPAKPVSQLSPYLSGIKESFPGIVLHVKLGEKGLEQYFKAALNFEQGGLCLWERGIALERAN